MRGTYGKWWENVHIQAASIWFMNRMIHMNRLFCIILYNNSTWFNLRQSQCLTVTTGLLGLQLNSCNDEVFHPCANWTQDYYTAAQTWTKVPKRSGFGSHLKRSIAAATSWVNQRSSNMWSSLLEPLLIFEIWPQALLYTVHIILVFG